MRAFLDEWLSDFRSKVPLVAFVALSLIGGLAGPFGTYDLLPVLPRLLLWSGVVGVALLAGTAIRAFVQASLGYRRFWPGAVLIAVVVTLLFTPPILLLAGAVFRSAPALRPSPSEIALFVFCCSLAMGAYRHAAGLAGWTRPRRARARAPAADPMALRVPPRLIRHLPAALQGRLIAISVRDHYVDVQTEAGRASLLMRMRDAVDQAEGEHGMQVHRSHWVALWAVQRIERAGGRAVVLLSSGERLPVSRAHLPRIEAVLSESSRSCGGANDLRSTSNG
jgi:hypothetical protein